MYGIKYEKEFMNVLKLFCKEVGAPKSIIVDSARTEKSNRVGKCLNKGGTTLCVLEEETQHADRAELYIVLMKRGVGKDMREMNSPIRLW